MQSLLNVASEKCLGKIINEHLKPRLLEFALHPIANFVVQSVIQCANQEQVGFHIYPIKSYSPFLVKTCFKYCIFYQICTLGKLHASRSSVFVLRYNEEELGHS